MNSICQIVLCCVLCNCLHIQDKLIEELYSFDVTIDRHTFVDCMNIGVISQRTLQTWFESKDILGQIPIYMRISRPSRSCALRAHT